MVIHRRRNSTFIRQTSMAGTKLYSQPRISDRHRPPRGSVVALGGIGSEPYTAVIATKQASCSIGPVRRRPPEDDKSPLDSCLSGNGEVTAEANRFLAAKPLARAGLEL